MSLSLTTRCQHCVLSVSCLICSWGGLGLYREVKCVTGSSQIVSSNSCNIVTYQSSKGIKYLVHLFQLKCPKVNTSEETYGIDLVSGMEEQYLCGLQINPGNTENHFNKTISPYRKVLYDFMFEVVDAFVLAL